MMRVTYVIHCSLVLLSDGDGQTTVTFGTLFNDDKCANIFEALVGTLRAAKRKKVTPSIF